MGKWNLDPGVGSSTDRPQEASDKSKSFHNYDVIKLVICFNPDHVGDIPTGSQTALRLPQASGTNVRFPKTAMSDFC